ncbi:oxidoreductase [Arthrobacter sp. MYb229]|nr:oxidoreductase [Arthrobacter sp. MYb229]PRB53543.1 oxidoreductase [Arthrobacter sp. MYb216]
MLIACFEVRREIRRPLTPPDSPRSYPLDAQHKTLELPGGVDMPALALGTWPMRGNEARDAVASALHLGYRHVDTAENYENEEAVGAGLRASGLPRDQVFLTSKFNKRWHSFSGVGQAFENSAQRLGVDYLDLFLIHWPNPDQGTFTDALAGLIELREQGKIRAAGVSNFKPAHLQAVREAGLLPAVNQIMIDPEHLNAETLAANDAHGVRTVAYTPLGRMGAFLQAEAISAPAAHYGKTPAQITLRWHVQSGRGAAPKSADPRRQAENLDIFDFELTDAQMRAIDALDSGDGPKMDSDSFGH